MPEVLNSLLQGSVRKVTFRSQLTPPYEYDPWSPSPPPSESQSWLMDLVKPEVIVDTAAGPISIAPYGVPEADYSILAAAGAVATLVGAVVAIGWVARATRRR